MRFPARTFFRVAATAIALSVATVRADAQTLLVGNGQGAYQDNTYGGQYFQTMSGYLNAAFGNQVTPLNDLSNTAQVLGFGRLWLDQRLYGTLSTQEYNNVAAFIATGRRVVMIGENYLWAGWNSQLLGLVGGTTGSDGCYFAGATTTNAGPLTAGVSSVYVPCAQTVAGGTSLFDVEFATLWGPNQNVLTIFDSNLLDDQYNGQADNKQFSNNVATWLAGGSTVVPEPSTFVLLGSALMVGAVTLRRRQKR